MIHAATASDVEQVRELFREYQRAIGVDLCFQGFDAELAGLPGAYAPPRGQILLAGGAGGCVALRPFGDDDTCEMKRLYVRPAHRGTGLGRRLATAIVDEARRAGYARMRLDTLATMSEAIGLYESLGFVRIAAYRHNPLDDAVYMELIL